jgi:hypothetical protein
MSHANKVMHTLCENDCDKLTVNLWSVVKQLRIT